MAFDELMGFTKRLLAHALALARTSIDQARFGLRPRTALKDSVVSSSLAYQSGLFAGDSQRPAGGAESPT